MRTSRFFTSASACHRCASSGWRGRCRRWGACKRYGRPTGASPPARPCPTFTSPPPPPPPPPPRPPRPWPGGARRAQRPGGGGTPAADGPGRAMKVAVIGAGWAGMAAAIAHAQAGRRVTVFEAARRVGGRARAVPGALPDGSAVTLDNGQHILIGAYRESLRLMRLVGVDTDAALLR